MTRRDRTALGVVLALGLIVGAWFLFVAPKRDEASRLGAQITTVRRQLAVEAGVVAAGEAARRQYASYSTELTRLERAVPTDDDIPSLIVQLQGAASRSGVDFRSLVLTGTGTSAPSAPPTPVAPASGTVATGAAAGAASSAATASSGGAALTSTSTPGATSQLPPGVSIGPAGLPQEPFTFTFVGSFFRLADFLGRLERFVVARNDAVSVSGRLMSLNAISLAAGLHGFPEITATINATTYLVPSVLTGSASTGTPAAPASPGGGVGAGAAGTPVTPTPAATVTP